MGRAVIPTLLTAILIGCGGSGGDDDPVEPVSPTAGGETATQQGGYASEPGPGTGGVSDPGGGQTAGGAGTQGGYPGATPETAVKVCGPRESYVYVAELRCAGGEQPLGGDPGAGSRARRGNVGPGPDEHILDLYDVPCPEGAFSVYVDMYHCPDGQPPY